MSVFDKYKGYYFDTNKEKNFGIKSGIVWGHSKDDNSISPVLYISKPKHVPEEDFQELLKALEIQFIIPTTN